MKDKLLPFLLNGKKFGSRKQKDSFIGRFAPVPKDFSWRPYLVLKKISQEYGDSDNYHPVLMLDPLSQTWFGVESCPVDQIHPDIPPDLAAHVLEHPSQLLRLSEVGPVQFAIEQEQKRQHEARRREQIMKVLEEYQSREKDPNVRYELNKYHEIVMVRLTEGISIPSITMRVSGRGPLP